MGSRSLFSGWASALGAAAFLGALSTAGAWVWANHLRDGAVLPGVMHGVVVFVALAVALGWGADRQGATRYLLLRLPPAGLVIAALFYPVAYLIGYLPALLVSWTAMWLTLAWARNGADGGRGAKGVVLGRGLGAAIGSGLAFWAISGIWTAPSPEPPDYLVRWLLWTLAFLPGFAALMVRWEPARAAGRGGEVAGR